MQQRTSAARYYAPCALLPGSDGTLYRAPALLEINSSTGRFTNVVPEIKQEDVPRDAVQLEGLVAPGFIDLQTNGAFGADVARDEDALIQLARRLPSTGVTTFLPTLVSSEPERYPWLLEKVAHAQVHAHTGARVLGAHLEGPFLNPARAGAHRSEHLRPIEGAWLLEQVDAHPGTVRLVTLAPELPDAESLIEALRHRGALVSAGHTEASFDVMRAACSKGLSLITHLSNAMPKSWDDGPLHFLSSAEGGERLQVRGGLILDGVHVRPPLVNELFARLGPRRIFLVTDAAPCAGMPDGTYTLGEMSVLKRGVTVHLASSPATLAGSALTMEAAVQHAVTLLRCSVETAVQMATVTPAEALGTSEFGVLRSGAWADFVQLQESTLRVLASYCSGDRVFSAGSAHDA